MPALARLVHLEEISRSVSLVAGLLGGEDRAEVAEGVRDPFVRNILVEGGTEP